MKQTQAGQTLIETIVAIFVLTSALITGLALTIYVLANSALNQNQIVATNLAREGVEMVRNMRDTNWLEIDKKGGTDTNGVSYSLTSCSDISGKYCFPKWLNGAGGSPYHNYDISASANSNKWSLDFTPPDTWSLGTSNNYNLYLQSDGSYTSASTTGSSIYARRLIVTYNTASPYTVTNPEVTVQAVVAWRGRRCTWSGNDPTVAPSYCKITAEEHMTNWKDYY